MFTVCPKCTLTLVVTTVDLRAGQGYVRCGRCANVFNALIALREGEPGGNISDTARRRLQETAPTPPANPAVGSGVAMDLEPDPVPEPAPEPEPESPDTEPAPEPEPELEAEVLPEIEAEAEFPLQEESLLEFDAAATDVSEIFISASEAEHDTGSGNYEAVVLSEESLAESEPAPEDVAEFPAHTDTIAAEDWSLLDDEPLADDESVIEESPLVVEETRPQPTATQPDPPWVEEMFAEAEAEAERVRTAEVEALSPELPGDEPPAFAEEDAAMVDAARASTGSTAPTDTALEPLLTEPVRQRPPWQYFAGVAVLVLALLLQVLHFNRHSLVLSTSVGPAVSTVYGWFGVTLMPRWDLTAYSVKQLGAEADGGESTRVRVRISLQNRSERVQPLPLLRLTLQDRFGNAVATRDLEPREYLPPAAADLRLLEPDQRIDAELHVVDPGRAAFNFEVDACLKGDTGAVGCSNDARRRAAG